MKKTYIESSNPLNWQNYQFSSASGSKTGTRTFSGAPSLLDQIMNSTQGGKMGDATLYDPNLQDIDPTGRNDFLEIPSFLSYPKDLGSNRRYHHFITFNIYQGSSDQVRLNQRKENQVTSAILAKGNVELFSQNGGQIQEQTAFNTLIDAGYPQDQAAKMAANYAAGRPVIDGVTMDERINTAEKIIQGNLGADPNSNIVSRVGQMGANIVVDGLTDIGSYLKTYLDQTLRDNLDPANQQKVNDVQRGISGKKLNRAKQDRNILLANRRFNFANVKSKDTICLYMPLKISFGDQLLYSEEDMGMTKNILDALALKRGSISGLIEKGGTSKIADLISAGTTTIGLEGLNVQGARNALTRSTANPRRELLFKDVGIRSHAFSFEFAPRNKEEADTVLNIIRMLRYHAYPGLLGGGGHFYTFPAEFQATFYTIDSTGSVMVNDNLPKIPRIALTSITVDYSGSGDFKTFTDAKPAFIKLDLQFQEMEQLTNEHIIHGY
jgi:hypothetical protein